METFSELVSIELLESRRNAFLGEMRYRSESPPYGDPVMEAFSEAFLEVGDQPEYAKQLGHLLKRELADQPDYANNLFFKAHQALLLDHLRYSLGYPQNFVNVSVWKTFMQRFQDPNHPDSRQLRTYLMRGDLQANKPQRGKSAAIAAALNVQEFGRAPVIFDVGAGANLVLKAMSMHLLDKTEVIDANTGGRDNNLSIFFNTAVQLSPFGRGIGIESSPPNRTTNALAYIKACSLNTVELDRDRLENNGKQEETFDLLAASPGKNVSLIGGDFLALPDKHKATLTETKADIVYFSHSLYQNPRLFDAMIRMARSVLNKRGLIVIQDFVDVHPDRPEEVVFENNWYKTPWRCKTLVQDPKTGEFIRILEWETPRNQRVRIMPGLEEMPKLWSPRAA